MDVMISYSHEDTDLMRLIKETLKSNGLTVWVDEDGLNAGVDFLSKIGQAVVECHTFLSIVTQASVSSKYCKDEVNLAYVSKRPIFAFSLKSKHDCYHDMDFGQKLIFSGVRFTTVGSEKTDVGMRQAAEQLADNIKRLLKELNLFQESEDKKKKDSKGSKSSKTRKWHTLDKFRRQRSSQVIEEDADDQKEIIFDVSAELFWNDCIGQKKSEASWELFEEKFRSKFKKHLDKFCTGDKDADWFMQVLKGELIETSNLDNPVINRDKLIKFCSTGKQDQRLWFGLASYVAEYSAISEVFSLQSTVRLDAINKLKEYNSRAAQETLMDLTRDRDPNVRATAAVTLAKVVDEGDQRAADRLATLLKDKDRLVRESSCVALGRIKCTEKVNDLVRVWRNDVISTVREAAQLALEHINSEEAKEAIHITRILADELKLLTTSSEPPAPTNKVEITSL
ncbi:uncharacterized protein LOC142341484 isoform X2 [Convolutriloba macropyga]|uniref:uncharacterized protein LOC142341484 isoform X2 n=1 Tax=Convolutriloba macropyga TaxID=536237 RepID=UPI003F523912